MRTYRLLLSRPSARMGRWLVKMGKTGWVFLILILLGVWAPHLQRLDAQDDRVLLDDRHLRTTSWEPGETALALYTMALPPGLADHNLTVVRYDREPLQPVGLRDGNGVEPQLGPLRAKP